MIISAARPWKRAVAWLVLLGPFFYLSYGAANAWAASRAEVPTVAFGWEPGVPFWPWTIFVYWSINVSYALSLFWGRSRHEVDRHGLRLLTAQLIAVACFLLWPLRFGFGEPPVDGASALLFEALRSFDQPFNQAPSLHIALALILWDWWSKRLQHLWARGALHAWTFSICASVLTTYQHHFIDIPTGALLGLLCIWMWPLERRMSMPMAWRLARDPGRWRLSSAYAVGAALCLWAALAWGSRWPSALWLGWPAAALTLVALNYMGLGARGFAMDANGRMHWAARWLFAPYRLGAALNARVWTHRLPISVEVAPGLRLGRLPSRREWIAAGRPRLVSLCAELQAPAGAAARCLPLLDLVVPAPAQLRRAALVVEMQRQHGSSVWVCCALGFSRSAAAVLAWSLARQPGIGLAQAEAGLRAIRPMIVLNPAWRLALQQCRPSNGTRALTNAAPGCSSHG